jgi:hypothetical protein
MLVLKGHQQKLELKDSHGYDRCQEASEMASCVFCDCAATEILRFRHLGYHFLKPVALADISVKKVLNFVQNAGLLNA